MAIGKQVDIRITIAGLICIFTFIFLLEKFPQPPAFQTLAVGSRVRSLAFDGAEHIVVGTVNSVQLWSARTYERQRTLEGAVGPATVSPDRHYIAAVRRIDNKDMRRTIGVWDSSTGDAVAHLTGHTATVDALSFNADGSLLASASQDGTVRIWRTSDMRVVHTLTWATTSDHVLAWSADGRLLATGDAASTIELWRTDDWRLERSIAAQLEAIESLAFSPDSLTLAASGAWSPIGVWSVRDGRSLVTLDTHGDPANTMLYSLDGRWLVSGSGAIGAGRSKGGPMLQVWRASDGKELASYQPPFGILQRRRILAVAISPDSAIVAGGDAGGVVRLWRAP